MKNFIIKYKIEIIEAYIAAAVYWFCVSGFEMAPLVAAVILGMANTYFIIPISNAIYTDGENKRKLELSYKTTFSNVLRAVVIVSILMTIYGVVYYILKQFMDEPWVFVEPISFGIFYKLIDIGLTKLMTKIKKMYNKIFKKIA